VCVLVQTEYKGRKGVANAKIRARRKSGSRGEKKNEGGVGQVSLKEGLYLFRLFGGEKSRRATTGDRQGGK